MSKSNTEKSGCPGDAPARERLDKVIKQRRLIRSRSRAQRMIEAGRVKVDDRVVTRPGAPIDPEAEIEVLSYERYVSRGGEKLEEALIQFRIEVKGRICLDIGASTGGFTDCLLQHGAAKVYAFDVGHDQMHARLRHDPRVVVREGINARYLEPQDIADPIDIVTVDVSFISLKHILPPLVEIVAPRAEIIALVKPQFEVGREALPKDGIVKDPAERQRAIAELETFIAQNTPWQVRDKIYSPIQGEKGNVEFFIHVT